MKKEAVTILKKTGKIACFTCLTLGAVAVVTSGAALKAMEEGTRFLVEKSREILKETDAHQEGALRAEAQTAEAVHSEPVPEEAGENAEEMSAEEI